MPGDCPNGKCYHVSWDHTSLNMLAADSKIVACRECDCTNVAENKEPETSQEQ